MCVRRVGWLVTPLLHRRCRHYQLLASGCPQAIVAVMMMYSVPAKAAGPCDSIWAPSAARSEPRQIWGGDGGGWM